MKGCDIIITISEKLEIVLKRLDISKKELADKLGTSQPNISKKFKYNDWRESDVKEICNKVIYLVDPGSTKLYKIIKGNQKEYEHLLNCNVVLNRSNIKNDSLKNFEYETHLKIVGNVPNLNERLDSNSELNDLVKFLVGNIKVKSSHGGLFSFLRRKK